MPAPDEEVLPLSCTEDAVHVSCASAPALEMGGVVLPFTMVMSLAVHPLALLVTVSV